MFAARNIKGFEQESAVWWCSEKCGKKVTITMTELFGLFYWQHRLLQIERKKKKIHFNNATPLTLLNPIHTHSCSTTNKKCKGCLAKYRINKSTWEKQVLKIRWETHRSRELPATGTLDMARRLVNWERLCFHSTTELSTVQNKVSLL